MTYTRAIEMIAYTWDRLSNDSETSDYDECAFGEIYGMIKMLSLIECESYRNVRNDVINYAHKHGRLLSEVTIEE